jgi:tRNA (guanine37-N1)-methyltransferase
VKVDIVTIFPRMVEAGLAEGLLARARDKGVLDALVHDLRSFTTDRHRVVDDTPFGGGPGMVMKPEPFFAAMDWLREHRGVPSAVLLPSPQGTSLTHDVAMRLARESHLVLLCGRYEGIDERVREGLATEEISIGDYVVSGGELPALVVVDAVTRLLPGAVGDPDSVVADSFVRGLLDHPHYTRPAQYRGRQVPDVLLSGHHAQVRAWRLREALARTWRRRPELVDEARLTTEERQLLDEIRHDLTREQNDERH